MPDDDGFFLPYLRYYTYLSDEEAQRAAQVRRKAVRVIAGQARDAADAVRLLDMLGLLDEARTALVGPAG